MSLVPVPYRALSIPLHALALMFAVPVWMLLTPAKAQVSWQGTHLDIEAIPDATAGETIQGNTDGTYQATVVGESGQWELVWGASSIPEQGSDPDPVATTWGRLKAAFLGSSSENLVLSPRPCPRAVPLARAVPETNQLVIGSEDGPYWMIVHDVAVPQDPLTFSSVATPRTWTVAGLFTDIQMEPDIFKRAWYVRPYNPNRLDNRWWAQFPVRIWGDMDTQSERDSLYARVQHMNESTGCALYVVDPAYGPPPVMGGIWWYHSSGGNWNDHLVDDAGEMLRAIIHTTQSAYSYSAAISRHEMLRALGMDGTVMDPRYGITNNSSGPFTQYDAALMRWYYRKCIATHQTGQNQAVLSEMY